MCTVVLSGMFCAPIESTTPNQNPKPYPNPNLNPNLNPAHTDRGHSAADAFVPDSSTKEVGSGRRGGGASYKRVAGALKTTEGSTLSTMQGLELG